MDRFGIVVLLLFSLPVAAGEADVLAVDAQRTGEHEFRFSVTVKHDDAGWDHYANRWEVVSPDGEVLATRELAHPHEQEQPFTRSLSGIRIPPDLSEVVVRAHDSVHGYGGRELTLPISDSDHFGVKAE
ncbi:hypothetical protein [Thiogranum longum]|jgi:hypothetical protein